MPIRNENVDVYSDVFLHYLNEKEEKMIDEASSNMEEQNPILWPKEVSSVILKSIYADYKKLLFDKGYTPKEEYLEEYLKKFSKKNSKKS